MARSLCSLELFTGAGGLALGLSQAGFSHLGLIERDRESCRTLRANARTGRWDVEEVAEGDARDIDYSRYGDDIDLLAAGVPCQPFSLGGVHQGPMDQRDMFPVLLEAVRNTRPKAVLVENVPGLLRESFRPYFDYIVHRLGHPHLLREADESWLEHDARLKRASSGAQTDDRYTVDFRVLNAANFGVPQKRVRLFVQAIRSDLGVYPEWPNETHSEALLVEAKRHGAYWEAHGIAPVERPGFRQADLMPFIEPSLKRWRTVRDALAGLPDPSQVQQSLPFSDHIFVPGARTYPGHTGSLLDEPAKTLKAGVHGVPGGEGVIILDDDSVRYLSIREAARLQTFPDDYGFAGPRTEAMRQIGNAVAVQLAERIGATVRRYFSATTTEQPLQAVG